MDGTDTGAGPSTPKRKSPDPLEKDGNQNPVNTSTVTISSSLAGLCKIAAKHFPLIMGVYLMGYFNVNVAWIIGLVGLTTAREQWKKERDYRMSAARAAALVDEEKVIRARVCDLPSWVYFPDFDRAEWLNKIIKQVWPNLGHYAKNIIVESVEPGIRESLKAYKLGGFKLDKISLGTIPLRVGGIKVYDKNISRSEIIMDVEIFYAGDCDIRFSVKGLKGGVKDFQLSGMLRVVLKPLISQIPLFGGAQIFFLNNPTVDFNLIGLADVLDVPGLSEILRRVILDQIGAFLVLPNKLTIQLSDVVPPIALKIPELAGVLRIRVIEAKDLMKMDVSVLGMGKSDPYAIITVGSQEFRTKTINNTINPKWNYYCEYTVSDPNGQNCLLQIFDRDDGTIEDDSIGKATVDIYSVVKAGKKDLWVTLEDVKTGMIHLELTWFSLSDNPASLKLHHAETQSLGLASAVVIVYIDSAKFLPCARTSSKPDPYVVVTVGNKSQQTNLRMRTTDPVWEQPLIFLVCNPESDDLQLKIMDQKTGNELGTKKIILVSLLTEPNMELPQQPMSLKNSGPESKIIIGVRLKVMVPGEPIETAEEVRIKEIEKKEAAKPKQSAEKPKSGVEPPTPEQTLPPISIGSSTNPPSESDTSPKIAEIPSTEKIISSTLNPVFSAAKINLDRESSIRRRNKGGLAPGVVSQVQLTLRYSNQRQKLMVVVHKASNLPGGDNPDLPDPYVKLYLLPDRTANSKRKTEVVKDSIQPVFDETFEYNVTSLDLPSRELEVSIINRKGLFARSPLMGQVKIPLNKYDLSQAVTQWFDLSPDQN